MSFFSKLKGKMVAGLSAGSAVITGIVTKGILVTATGVTIEASDLATITDANSAYLSSAFQVVELMPYIAVLSGGFFVLNKMFSIIPSSSGGRT